MRASLHRWLVASIAVAVARASFAAEVSTPSPPLRSVTVSIQADRGEVVLYAPRTNRIGESEWATVCVLPCEGLQLSPRSRYRVEGTEVLPSDPFALLPDAESQAVTVRSKTPHNRNSARGLIYGGLVGVGIGAAIIIPSTLLLGSAFNGGSEAAVDAVAGAAFLVGLGTVIALAGTIIATIGGINLANCDTTVTVTARPANAR